MSKPETAAPVSYQRVREILQAAGGSSDYGGLGPLWELPLPRLLDASLYGVRLVAPEETRHSCCSHVSAPAESRSSRSGLVQGLRGEAPFDGTHFPRLPWGGKPLAPADIELIAEWIDGGCVATDKHVEFNLAS